MAERFGGQDLVDFLLECQAEALAALERLVLSDGLAWVVLS